MAEKTTDQVGELYAYQAEQRRAWIAEGIKQERERILNRLQSYFDLTQEETEGPEGATPNEEWDHGFQAAIAIAKGYDSTDHTCLMKTQADGKIRCHCGQGISVSLISIKEFIEGEN